MSRQSGSLSLSSNLEPKMAAPLDAREKVANLTELTDPNSFPYSWIGMPVYVVSEQKWYSLRYADTTSLDNWVTIGTGADGHDGRDVGIEGTTKEGRENTVTFVWYDPTGSDRYTDLVVLDGAAGPEGPRGPEGPAGADGQSFSITGIYESYEAMVEAHPTGNEGDAYFVQSDEEGNPPDVYVWLSEDNEWNNIGPLQGGRGVQGPTGPQGYSPEITVAETTDSSYKLRVTNQSGSYLTPNLKGDLAPIDTIDPASAVPVQSKTIAAALDTKQPKILATPVAVRDYLTKQLVDQTTVQATLEALAACVNYVEVPVQFIGRFDDVEHLPTGNSVKPGSLALVGSVDSDKKKTYIYTEQKKWEQSGGTSDDNMVELDANEIDAIWAAAADVISWMSGTALPDDFGSFGACVYDGEINILGGYMVEKDFRNHGDLHYRLNNGIWESVSTLPHAITTGTNSWNVGQVVTYDNKIYVVNNAYMDAWDGTEWTTVATIPFSHRGGGLVVYDDDMYLIGGELYSDGHTTYNNPRKLRKWNGTEWVDMSEIPFDFVLGGCIVYDNKIHIIGGNNQQSQIKHYTWDGTDWEQIVDSNYPPKVYLVFEYNDTINALSNDGRYEYHDNAWVKQERPDVVINNGTKVVVQNGHVHLLGGQQFNGSGSPRAHRILQ